MTVLSRFARRATTGLVLPHFLTKEGEADFYLIFSIQFFMPMIKLILTLDTQPITYIFEKKSVIIGKSSPDHSSPDLILVGESLKAAHVKIIEQEGRFIAYNLTDDPYTTINGRPFGKRILCKGDILEIDGNCLQFEGSAGISNSIGSKVNEILKTSPQITGLKIGKQPKHLHTTSALLLPFFENPSPDKNKDIEVIPTAINSPPKPSFSNGDIEALLRRVEELEMAFTGSEEKRAAPNASSSKQKNDGDKKNIEFRPSLKDDYLKEFDDSNENWNSSRETKPIEKFIINWKSVTSFFGVLTFLMLAAFGFFYLTISGRMEGEEIEAAEAVADVAMALNFALINHASSQNHNWSDPDFLKHNLTSALAPGYHPLANVDSHGQFLDIPYILRIYTSNDLSHFLVIAQPNASLEQWLVPKSTILVDSQFMELRKMRDLKSLNRLLVNPTLDTTNSAEITNLVKKGELIPLHQLRQFDNNTGFISPKALPHMRPGAENLIYNALRYYNVGESLIKKMISVYEDRDDSHDIGLLTHQVETFAKFPNIVLYSSEGIQTATTAQKALAALFPKQKFLFAYLQSDSRGYVNNAYLIGNPHSTETNSQASTQATEDLALQNENLFLPEEKVVQTEEEHEPSIVIPKIHSSEDPLFLLHKLYQHELQRINDEIYALIREENRKAIPNFSNKLTNLRKESQKLVEQYQEEFLRIISLEALSFHLKDISQNEHEYLELKVFQENISLFASPLLLESSVKKTDSLYDQLMAYRNIRQDAFKTISNEMLTLLDNESNQSESALFQELDILISKYEQIDIETKEIIAKGIKDLQQEYENMPFLLFLSYVKATELEEFFLQEKNLESIFKL